MKPNVEAFVKDESLPLLSCPGVPGAEEGCLDAGGGYRRSSSPDRRVEIRLRAGKRRVNMCLVDCRSLHQRWLTSVEGQSRLASGTTAET